MAGYYYATPIGKGLSGLAQAISGTPQQVQQAGLMASRQALVDQQAENEVVERELIRQRQNLVRRQAEQVQQETTGRTDLAGIFSLLPNAPLKADDGPLPNLPMPVAPQVVSADYGLGAPGLTDAVAGGYTPSVPIRPRTRQELMGEAYGQSVLAGAPYMSALPKTMLGFGGAMNATTPEGTPEPYNPRQMTALGVGAGEAYSGTPLGFSSHETRLGGEAAARNTTTQRGQDIRASTDLQQTNIQEAGKDRRKEIGGKGKGTKRPLTHAEERKLDKEIEDEAAEQGVPLTSRTDRAPIIAEVRRRVADGEEYTDAVADVLSEMVTEEPGEEPGAFRKFFGAEAKPVKKLTVPGGEPAAPKPGAAPPKPGAPKPAAAASAAAPLVVKNKSQLPPKDKRVPGKTRIVINDKSMVWSDKGWQPE